MVGWHRGLNGHEFEQTQGDKEGQESLVSCSSWGCKELDTTERLNTNNNNNRGNPGFPGGMHRRELLVLPPQSEGKIVIKAPFGTSLVARVQNLTAGAGDRFNPPIWEDPTCCGGMKPVHRNH